MKKGNKILLVIFIGVVVGLLLTFLMVYLIYSLINQFAYENDQYWQKQFGLNLPKPISVDIIAEDTDNFHGDGPEYIIKYYDSKGIKYLKDNNKWIALDNDKLGYATDILRELIQSPEVSQKEKDNIDKNYPVFHSGMLYSISEYNPNEEGGSGQNRIILVLDEENNRMYEFDMYT